MNMDILKVIILSIVEGITEFLPVSSTGHLIVVNEFIALEPASFANAFNINGSKRISYINAFSSVAIQNSSRIVTAHTQGRLRQVIRTKPEETCGFGNIFCL